MAFAGHSTGHNLWIGNSTVGTGGANSCTQCHIYSPYDNYLNAPQFPQLNAANPSTTSTPTLDYVFPKMFCTYATGLTGAQREAIQQYFETLVPADIDTSMSMGNGSTFLDINVNSGGTRIQLGGYAFTHVATASNPVEEGTATARGSLNFTSGNRWTATTVRYTPPANFVGYVTFNWRGTYYNSGTATTEHNGISRQIRIQVGTVPSISGSSTHNSTYNAGAITPYQITATPLANPTTFSVFSGSLPPGLTLNASTGQVTGTPTTAGSYPVTFRASNNLGNSNTLAVTFAVARATPSVSFAAPSPQTYSSGGTFNVPTATVSPAQAVTDGIVPRYSVASGTACTKNGGNTTTLYNIASATGSPSPTCVVRANTALATNWNAAANVDHSVTINKANQTITFPAQTTPARNWSNGGTYSILPLATTDAAVQAGIAIVYGVHASSSGICSVNSGAQTFTTLRAGTCTITADEDGNGNYNAAGQQTSAVTINAVAPSAPTIGTATPGDTQASIAFTPLNTTNDGGVSIGTYTATCNPGGITGNNTTTPIVVSGLTNNTAYTCSVTATQSGPGLTSPSSGTVGVTPQPTPVPPAFTSANSTTFTVAAAGNFDVTATGVPAPTITLTSGSLPSGVTFNAPGTSPRTLTGTPASGTAGSYPLQFTATGTAPAAVQNFTLTVDKRSQSVNFTDPADTTFGSGNVALTASATSGMAVTFASLTPLICGIAPSGTDATLLDVGDCTIRASQAGDVDWVSAFADQTFAIAKGNQTITFATQDVTSRPVSPGATFLVSPTATVTSPLTVTYSTSTPTVCTVSSQSPPTIQMGNAGVCTIVASQAGNTQWNAAVDKTQNVTLNVASQTINFPAQAAQNYVPSGTFAINPVATASSGLAVTYFSNTSSICTISGSTVTIVTIGTCSIRAEQSGDGNFTAATPVSQTIQINPVVPAAPTIGTATPGNQHAKVAFTAPSNDGGTPITGYRATCSPGGATGTGTTSPVTVNGLVNGQAYTCTVAAENAVGFSPESASTGVMPSLQGAALWAGNCQSCHGATPGGARFNAAGASTSTAVLDYVISTNPQMNVASLNALTSLERQDLKQYITSYLLSSVFGETTATNMAKVINLGGHLSLNTAFPNPPGPDLPGSFTNVVIDVQPTNGTLTLIGGVEFLYTPNPGFTGVDTFQYHGAGNVTGDTFTFTINVDAAAPVLTVARNGTGGGLVFSDTPTSGINCGSDCTEAWNSNTLVSLIAAANPGSTFIGWTGACTGSSVVCNVTMNASKSVTATFDLTPFDLTVSRSGAGTGTVTSAPAGINCGATCTAGFPPGTPVTLTPTPAAGSAFTGWSGDCTGTGACIVTMDAAKAVTATFQPTYVLTVARSGLGSGTVASSPAGIDCGATCSNAYLTGTVVSLTPTPAAGSAFTGWSGDCTGTGACNVTMTAARNVTANFTPIYRLTYTKLGNGSGTVVSTPAGINCTSSCTADFLDTTVVNLSATIGADTDFLGWGGECSGTGACSVTMSQARNVTANFKSSIALTVTINGSGSGVVTSSPEGIGVSCGTACTVGFDPGTVVTLGRSPAAGSIFAGWTGACTGTGACVLTMSQSRSVTATFNLASGPQADVGIAAHTSNPPSAASVGQQVTFTLTVANNGPAGATNVVLTDTLPTGATFVSASPGCIHNAGTVTCAIGSLANGASTQVQIVVQPTAAGGATNFASVTSAETDPLSFNNASALAISVTTAANLGRLTNISTRGLVQTGDNVMIGGFIIGGAATKTVVVRARGPSLAQFGVPGVLANPQLVLYSGQTPIASNDNWGDAANAAAITASGFAPSDPNEAAILMQLAPGAYTAIMTGAGGGTGIGIVEVFEVDAVQIPLANISTRGFVATGDAVMIGGFVIQGDGPQSVVIRARGPSLAQFGVQGVLANPQVQLFSGNTQVAANDNWGDAANAAAIAASGFAPTDPLESGLLVTLQPGAYTVIMTGVGGGTGIGIVEVFRN